MTRSWCLVTSPRIPPPPHSGTTSPSLLTHPWGALASAGMWDFLQFKKVLVLDPQRSPSSFPFLLHLHHLKAFLYPQDEDDSQKFPAALTPEVTVISLLPLFLPRLSLGFGGSGKGCRSSWLLIHQRGEEKKEERRERRERREKDGRWKVEGKKRERERLWEGPLSTPGVSPTPTALYVYI